MSEREETKTTSEDVFPKSETDMEALCEGISQIIVEGLLEGETELGEESAPAPDAMAETGLIAPLGDMVTKRAVSTVESLLDSEEISGKILDVIKEKVELVLNEDLAQGRGGKGGLIAERVHLECARFLGGGEFREEIVHLVSQRAKSDLLPVIKEEAGKLLRGALSEVTELILSRVADLAGRVRRLESSSPGGEPVDAQAVFERMLPRAKEEILEEVRRFGETLSEEVGRRVNEVEERLSARMSEAAASVTSKAAGERRGSETQAGSVRAGVDPVEKIRERLYAKGLL